MFCTLKSEYYQLNLIHIIFDVFFRNRLRIIQGPTGGVKQLPETQQEMERKKADLYLDTIENHTSNCVNVLSRRMAFGAVEDIWPTKTCFFCDYMSVLS